MKITVIEDVKAFPLVFELCKVLNHISAIRYALTEKSTLYGNCDPIVFGVMDHSKTIPDLARGCKSGNVNHLFFADVVGY